MRPGKGVAGEVSANRSSQMATNQRGEERLGPQSLVKVCKGLCKGLCKGQVLFVIRYSRDARFMEC